MNDIAPIAPLRLEVLPDEMLLEIFQYMKPIDLLRFKDQNQRLNSVTRDIKLNIIIEYPEEEDDEKDLEHLMDFPPEQVLRLESSYGCKAFDLHVFQELLSLTLNCTYLSKNQIDQVFTVKLQHLERISIDNVPYYFCKELLLIILDQEHFPSLKICQFTGEFPTMIEINDHCLLPNKTMRALILSQWYGSEFASLLKLLPNLQRFETNINKSVNWLSKIHKPHMSLADVQVTLNHVLNDLDGMLRLMPNLKRLSVNGKINISPVLKFFKKLAKIMRSRIPNLQRFDCELYFHSSQEQIDTIIIRQHHPLFRKIQYLLRNNRKHYYATDLTEYWPYIEYRDVSKDLSDFLF